MRGTMTPANVALTMFASMAMATMRPSQALPCQTSATMERALTSQRSSESIAPQPRIPPAAAAAAG